MAGYVDWYNTGPRLQTWCTPPELFNELNAAFHFDFDGASSDDNALVESRGTESDLWPMWSGRRVFCNPPWNNIAPFVEAAASAECAVLLVPARVNTVWFHRALELGAQVGYLKRRPSFIRDGVRGKPSPVDVLMLIWRS